LSSAPPITWLARSGVASAVTSITSAATRHSRYVRRTAPCAATVTSTERRTPENTGQLAIVTNRTNQRVPVLLTRGIPATRASGPITKSVAVRMRESQFTRNTAASATSWMQAMSASYTHAVIPDGSAASLPALSSVLAGRSPFEARSSSDFRISLASRTKAFQVEGGATCRSRPSRSPITPPKTVW
jgi:hypothetical protein